MSHYFLMILFLLLGARVQADGLSVEVDHTIVELGDRVVMNVRAEGDADGPPEIPVISGVQSQYHGPQTSISIVNGRTSRSTTYVYSLVPEKVGEFVIPALRVKIDGKEYASKPLKVKVIGAGQTASGEAPPVFVSRALTKNVVWVGEPVMATISLHHRVQIHKPQVDPATPTTVKRMPIDGQVNKEALKQGVRYYVAELAEVLVPLKPGNITLPPYKVTVLLASQKKNRQRRSRSNSPFGVFDDFFNDPFSRGRMSQRTFQSEPFNLEVKPLPAAPDKFSGIVGQYVLRGRLSSRSVEAGNTVTLTVELEGQGNLEGASIFEDLAFDGVKVYPDKPDIAVNATLDTGLTSKGVFKFALVPNVTGELKLGELELVYFNSDSGKYEKLNVPMGAINVSGSASAMQAGQTDFQPSKRRVKKLNDDLIGLHRGTKLLSDHSIETGYVLKSLVFATLPFFIGLYGWWRRRFLQNADYLRSRDKSKIFNETKTQLNALNIEASNEWIREAVAVVRRYFGVKLDLKSEALTIKDIKNNLESRHNPEMDLSSVERLFNYYNSLEYGRVNVSAEETHSLMSQIIDLLALVEGKRK